MISILRTDSRFTSLMKGSLVFVAVACGGSGYGGYGAGPMNKGGGGGNGGGSGGRTTSIDMTSNLTFVPKVDTVTMGQTVTWTTQAGSPDHTTTSDTNCLWDSGLVSAGQSLSHTFSETGTFPYHCTFHQGFGMVGTIVVMSQ